LDGTRFIVDIRTNEEYKPNLQDAGIKEDYGIVSRLPNPFSPVDSENVVFLLEGAHTCGLAAAGRILTSDYCKDLVDKIKSQRAITGRLLFERL
jgi:hypothetical protein